MIEQSVDLALAPPEAFALFTERISEWWPADRRHTSDPASTLHLLASGRFFERASDGREVELGRVTAWEPPQRILLDFFIATGPDHPTEAEIRFEPIPTGTRVVVRHRPKAASRHLWDQRAPRYARSWEAVLAALAQCAV